MVIMRACNDEYSTWGVEQWFAPSADNASMLICFCICDDNTDDDDDKEEEDNGNINDDDYNGKFNKLICRYDVMLMIWW